MPNRFIRPLTHLGIGPDSLDYQFFLSHPDLYDSLIERVKSMSDEEFDLDEILRYNEKVAKSVGMDLTQEEGFELIRYLDIEEALESGQWAFEN